MAIKIVTDSTSDLPKALATQHGIEVVPLKVLFGEETYLDGVDMNVVQFYEKLQSASVHPKTSQPAPSDFLAVYQRILAEPTTQIISIHISSVLSGTSEAASIARSMLDEADQQRVTIIDSKITCFGLGFIALRLAKAVSGGADLDTCVQLAHSLRANIRLYFVVDTLEFLQKGGRIGKASAFFGSLLNIKPILTIDDEGSVAAVEKVRGRKQAQQKMLELLQNQFANQQVEAFVLKTPDSDVAEGIAAEIRNKFQIDSLEFAQIGPVIGVHVGPGAIAVMMVPK